MEQAIIDWQQEFFELQSKYENLERMNLFFEKRCNNLSKRIAELEDREPIEFQTGECLSCGEVFQTSKKGRKKLHCSARCRKREQRVRQLFTEYENVTFL